ncbi:MAG: hypothetical protein MUF58_18955 [Arcicella sp.]|jgi:hypothetical protein|nr:hypothetical protein [Arcicella sp.]
MIKKTKPLSVNAFIEGIDLILSKNRESLTVDESKMLKEVKEKLLSQNSSNQFIKTALLNLICKKLFDLFLGDEFNEWKQMLENWFKETNIDL